MGQVSAVGVIPARFGSTRFPGKPLQLILGKPLLQWVIEAAKNARRLSEVRVATDHRGIADLAERNGVRAVMTLSECPTGSDRVFAATSDSTADVVINIQGDEPLVTGALLDTLVGPLEADPGLAMATLGRELAEGDLLSPNTAKIVLNRRDEALYFSRLPIPFSLGGARVDPPPGPAVCLKHIGIYAYRKTFLAEFCAEPPTALEKAESLEQLRALWLGARIKVVRCAHESWGVDTPGDVAVVEARLRAAGFR